MATIGYFLFCLILSLGLTESKGPPNIIFILADDLGWNDVSFHGSRQIPTPNLDTLAYDGILLSNYYVQPICTPTRGALLTGRHPIHTGLQEGVIVGSQKYGLPLNETILPQYLGKLGYKSHMVGKWHLGFFAEEYTPTRRGFLSHFGYFTGKEDYWDHTNQDGNKKETWGLDFHRNNEVVRTDFGKYSTELFTNEAEKIINEHNASEPLFLYLPFQAVHSSNRWQPLEAPYEYYEKFSHINNKKRRMFAAMVSCLDDAVGNITKALHNKGLLENSVLVFSTDNGGPPNGFDMNYASNEPLRGTKAGLWEGGVHGDGFIWSPLLQESGYTSHAMIQVIDWLPTLLSVAGYDMTTLPHNIDGMDQWAVLSAANTKGYRTEMLHNIDDSEGSWALRIEDMKLISAKHGYTAGWRDWYQTEGENLSQYYMERSQMLRKQSDIPITQQQSSFTPSEEEVAPAHMFESDLKQILKMMGRSADRVATPYVVKCGPKPADAAINCNITSKPCLYNVTADPCEYHNLADKMPDVVTKMMERLEEYKKTAVRPGNTPQDPKGWPVNNGGLWVPWVKLSEEP